MKTAITVQNLRCGGCANTITKKLSVIDGVSNVSVDIDGSTIHYEAQNNETVAKATEQLIKLGYPEASKDNSIGLKAKSFVSCATGKFGS